MRITEKGFFSLLIFLFAVILLSQTAGMRSDVVLVPRIVGLVLLLFSLIQVLSDWVPSIGRRIPFMNKKVDPSQTIGGEGAVEESETKEEQKRRFLFTGWMILFIVVIYFTNMIGAIFIAMFIYLKWITKESLKLSIIYSGILTLVIYLAFVVVLDVYYFI
jgi:hypothetical protein